MDAAAMEVEANPLDQEAAEDEGQEVRLVDLPDCVLENVLKYLSFDQIAQMRILSRRFNHVCADALNRGFWTAWGLDKKVQSDLTMGGLYFMLVTQYTTFMALGMCCFIPGRILDHMFKILRTYQPAAPEEFFIPLAKELQNDIEKATLHFRRTIVPSVKDEVVEMKQALVDKDVVIESLKATMASQEDKVKELEETVAELLRKLLPMTSNAGIGEGAQEQEDGDG